MEWVIEYLEDDGIVYGKTSGVLDVESLLQYNREMITTGRKHGSHKLLTDLRDTTGEFTILEIDDMPKVMAELGITPEDKNAVIYNPANVEQRGISFFKDLAKINSLRYGFFRDRQKAIDWLNANN